MGFKEYLSYKKLRAFAVEFFSVVKDNRYLEISSTIALISIVFFILLNFLLPLPRSIIFDYYLKEGILYGVSTIIIVFTGAFFAGITTSYIFKKFNYNNILLFSFIYIIFFGIFYYFMLAESSFSFFVYVEMNGIFDGFLNAYTLYATIVLSAFLVIQLKETLKAGFSTGSGIIAALFSLGCPSCGALLWSLVGLGGLSFLPFNGFELRALSLALLIWATIETYKVLNFKDKKVSLEFKV